MNAMTNAGAAALMERAQRAGWPELSPGILTGASTSAGEQAWRLGATTWTREQAKEVSDRLAILEAAAEREAAQAAERERQAAGPDSELLAIEAAERAQAEAERRAYEAARPARVEQLLERIAASLDALAKR